MKWLILLTGIAANASASILIKLATTPPRKFPSLSAPVSIFDNWPFLLGIVLYGAAFFLYAAALTKLPLNVAHPILTSGAIAIVAVFSMLIFRDPFYWTTGIGIVLVMAGVVLITLRTV